MAPSTDGWAGQGQGRAAPAAQAPAQVAFERDFGPLILEARSVDELAGVSLLARSGAAAAVAAWSARSASVSGGPGDEAAEPAAADVAALTDALSRLSDEVTRRAVQIVADEMRVDLREACWLAFGSQARGEQTLLTDQDNGLVFAADDPEQAEARRPAWQAFGQRVNEALARCGYPLCDGRVMAGQPLCCLSAAEWSRRFEHWMAHGDGNDLFAARIYFDTRPVAGNAALAQPLLDLLRAPAASVPRFAKQLADVVLRTHVPLSWLGRIVTTEHAGEEVFDLKAGGTALFVDAGRLWALAHGLAAVGTAARLRAAAQTLRVPAAEAQAWVEGFQTLQRLRLCAQQARLGQGATGPTELPADSRARVRWSDLDAAARRELGQALRAARTVLQRIELDYCR